MKKGKKSKKSEQCVYEDKTDRHDKEMENGGYNKDPEKGTELLEQKKGNSANGAASTSTSPSTSCRPAVCQAARTKYAPPDLRGSPWHRKKTIYLCVILAALVLWGIIYSTLSVLHLL